MYRGRWAWRCKACHWAAPEETPLAIAGVAVAA